MLLIYDYIVFHDILYSLVSLLLFIAIVVTVMDEHALQDLNGLDNSLIVLSRQSYMPYLMNPSMQACQLSVQFPSVIHEFSPCTTMMLPNFDSYFLYDSIDACTLELYCHQLNYGLDSAFQLQQDFLDLGITTLNFMYKLREVYPSFPHMFVLLD